MEKNNSFWNPVKPNKNIKPAKLFGFEMNPKPNKAYYIKQPRIPITPINFKVPKKILPLASPFHPIKLSNNMNRVSPVKNLNLYPARTKTEVRLISKNPWGDKDKDGVPNYFDCRPMNRKKQDAIIKFPSGRFMRFVSKSDIPATLKDTKIETPEQFRDVEDQINKISAAKMKTEPGKRSTNPLYQKPVELALDKGYETIRAHPVVNEMGHKMILKGRLNQDILTRLNQQPDVQAHVAPDAESTIILVNQTGKSQKEVEDYMTKVIDVIPRKKMGEGGYLPSNVSLKGFKTVDGFVDLTTPQMAPDETIPKNEMDLLLRPKMVGVTEEERVGKESTSLPVSMMVPEKTKEDIELDTYLAAHPEIKSPEEYRNKKRGRKKGSTLDKTLIYRVTTPTNSKSLPKVPVPESEQPKRGRGRPRKAVQESIPTKDLMYTPVITPTTISRGRGRPKKEDTILREQAETKLRKQEEQNIQNILDIFQKASPKERKIIETRIEEFKSKFPQGTGGYDREKKQFESIKKGKEKQKKLSERLKDVWQNRKEIFGTRKVGKTEKIPLKEIKEILEQERELNIKKQFGNKKPWGKKAMIFLSGDSGEDKYRKEIKEPVKRTLEEIYEGTGGIKKTKGPTEEVRLERGGKGEEFTEDLILPPTTAQELIDEASESKMDWIKELADKKSKSFVRDKRAKITFGRNPFEDDKWERGAEPRDTGFLKRYSKYRTIRDMERIKKLEGTIDKSLEDENLNPKILTKYRKQLDELYENNPINALKKIKRNEIPNKQQLLEELHTKHPSEAIKSIKKITGKDNLLDMSKSDIERHVGSIANFRRRGIAIGPGITLAYKKEKEDITEIKKLVEEPAALRTQTVTVKRSELRRPTLNKYELTPKELESLKFKSKDTAKRMAMESGAVDEPSYFTSDKAIRRERIKDVLEREHTADIEGSEKEKMEIRKEKIEMLGLEPSAQDLIDESADIKDFREEPIELDREESTEDTTSYEDSAQKLIDEA